MCPEKKIGIEKIVAYVPGYFVKHGLLDTRRGREPLETYNKLGQKLMAVPASCEDAVTLAANAARKILKNISPEEIGMLFAATESGVDQSKALSTYLHGLLHLPSDVENSETKFACLAGINALGQAFNWIKTGQNRGRSALIVCSDIARYRKGSSPEPTQGAGAVAMLISENPSLVILNEHRGIYSKDVMDFWRPLNSEYAEVNGRLSIVHYLSAIKGAYRDYRKKGGMADPDRLVFHTPFAKLPRQIGAELIKIIGEEEDLGEFSDAKIKELVERKIGPSLIYPELVGNIYTASTLLALLSLIENENCKEKTLGIGAYGSGCGSIFLSGKVICDKYNSGFKEELEDRIELPPKKYDRVVYGGERLDIPEQKGCVIKKIGERGDRYYEFLD